MTGSSFLAAGLMALTLSAPALSAPLADHKDERLGYSIRVPNKWNEVPLRTNEHWVVGRWTCNKVDRWTDPDAGMMTREHRSELRAIAFIEEIINRPDFEEDDDEEGRSRTKIRIGKVYRDYPDYLRGTFPDGFYISKEEPGQLGDHNATYYEVTIETDTGAGERTMLTWVVEMEIAHVALEFEVLDDSLKEKLPLIKKTFRSFKEIPRTIPINMSDYDDSYVSLSELEKMKPEERARQVRSRQDKEWEKILSTLPDDWKTDEVDGIRVVHKVDDKYVKKICGRINAVHNCLEKNFGEIGKGEYVRKPILRICESYEEEQQFAEGNYGSTRSSELVTHKGDYTGFEGRYLNLETLNMWFMDRDADLFYGLPAWIRNGLNFAFGGAEFKRGSIKFDKKITNNARASFRESGYIDIGEVMMMNSAEFNGMAQSRDYRAHYEAAALVQYLLDKPKGKAKTLLMEYMTNVGAALDAIDAEEKEARKENGYKRPETEEEEEKALKEREERFKANERRILEQAYTRTFQPWSTKEKESFEASFMRGIQ